MGFNLSRYILMQWGRRAIERVREAVLGMVEVITLESLYPGVETVDVETGKTLVSHSIMPHQRLFHDKKTPSGKEALFCAHSGGFGSGKSVCAAVEMVHLLRTYPGIKIVVIAPYQYYFDEFIWPTFEEVLPFDDPFVLSKNRNTGIFRCVNGSVIRFKAYDDPGKIKGWEAHVLWFEEAGMLGDGNNYKAKTIFNAALGRLRAKPNYIPRRVYITQNPVGHNWVWKLFVKGTKEGDEGIKTVIPACKYFDKRHEDSEVQQVKVLQCQSTCSLDCNKYPKGLVFQQHEKVTASGDVYYAIASGTAANINLRAGYQNTMHDSVDSAEERSRNVEGLWNPINSMVYEAPLYSPSTHVLPIEAIRRAYGWNYSEFTGLPHYLPLIVGIDVGGPKSPWAVEMYVILPDELDGQGEIMLCIGEYYQAGVTWDEVIYNIKELTDGWENVQYWIDPYSAPQKQGPDQVNVKEQFELQGIKVRLPKGCNISSGILLVKNLLLRNQDMPNPFVDDEWDEDERGGKGGYAMGRARLYYAEGCCPANLKEKEVWRYDAKKQREGKEAEEGLSPVVQEKPVDRDDHAQRAEHFAAAGWAPMPAGRNHRYNAGEDEDEKPRQRYASRRRTTRGGRG